MNKKIYNPKFKTPLTKEFLIDEYINKNKSSTQIMKENNLSASKVAKRLKKLGIFKPKNLKYKRGKPELKTKKALEKMYYEEKLSITQIAERLDMSYGSVNSLFICRGISINKKFRYERARRNDNLRVQRLKEKAGIKKFIKEGNRQRVRKTGTKCKEETKLILSEKAIDRGILVTRRTKEETLAGELIKKIAGIIFIEQVGIKIYEDNKYKTGYIFDFLITSNNERPIVLEIDGYHHFKRKGIMTKDKIENNYLCKFGFSVIRIKSEFTNLSVINDSIEVAKKIKHPVILSCAEKIIINNQENKINNNITAKLINYNHKIKKVVERDINIT